MTRFKPEDIPAILAAFDGRHAKRNRLLFRSMLMTAYRITEILSWQVGDVWDGKNVVTEVVVDRRFMKGKKKSRDVVIPLSLEPHLEEWLKEIGTHDTERYVFASQKGGQITRIQAYEIFNRAYEQAGIEGKHGTHGVRKQGCYDYYVACGKDIEATRAWMKHSKVNITQIYIQGEVDDEQRRMQRNR